MPPSLAELQRGLADVVLGTGGSPRPGEFWVPPGADVASRIAIYAEGYPARVKESLREAYPAIANILGEGSFDGLVRRYLQCLPPGVRNLNRAGVGLPAFLRSESLTQKLPFLPDLARLEWAVVECFHSERLDRFDGSRQAGWSPEQWARAQVEFQPGVALVCSDWPLVALRETRDLERSAIDVDLVGRPDRVLVQRRASGVVAESVDEVEAAAVAAVLAGASLEAVTRTLAARGAGPDRVLQLFTRWTRLGLVADCRLGAERCR